jgi:hypothetical protein
MAISVQKKVEEVKKAIKLLAFQGYTILDLEDNMINKWNINDNKKYNISYNRVPKRKTL